MDSTSSQRGPTSRLAHWAAAVPRERTLAARVEAQRGIKDLVGCLIGGAIERVPKIVAKVATSTSGQGLCTIVGQTQKVPAQAAAYANGTAAHILDFDDSFRPLTGHPSCTIVPAILAVAEERGSSGDDVLDAYVVGIEIAACLGRAAPKHHDCGWHGTATVGVISSAAACARLMKLDAAGITNAISMAFSASSGGRVQIGYDIKSMQPGAAARDAVVAATMAAAGIVGCSEVLTGPWGWSKVYSNVNGDGSEYTMPDLAAGEPLAIQDPGITFKPYPTCGSTHRTLNAVLELVNKYDIRADDVESIETTIPFLNTANLRYLCPANGMQGRFCMSYTCALAVLYRQILLSDFEDDAVQRPEVQAFMPKVTMNTLPGSEHTDKTYLEMPCHTRIKLRSGTFYDDTRYDRRGEASDPLTGREEQDKFYDCTSKVMSTRQADQVMKLLDNMSEVSCIKSLMDLL
ncbi:unnamed protein product [Clonostachys solani]|uniref:MmgE/PrpD family protein n=1 Tax=Clonostachys solani TaxID=160281 RepID=A0A9N9ZJZ9_9HYPO|nr:unnamed protein product [Clonostachys solani]